MKQLPSGEWLLEQGFKGPSRGLFIGFMGHPSERGSVYHLFNNEILEMDDETREIQMAMTLPSAPPSLEHFETWRSQATNQASRALFDEFVTNNAIAEISRATYLTESPFEDELLNLLGNKDSRIPAATVRAVATFDLPFMEGVELDTLMSIRDEESDAFSNFRIELERRFRDIRLETDPEKVAQLTENAFHELTDAQVREIEPALRAANNKLKANVALATGALATSVHTGGWSLIALAVAGVKGYSAYQDQRSVRARPAHLIWRLKQASRS